MLSESEIRKALRSWILTKVEVLGSAELADQTPLFDNHLLRSAHLPELLLLLERLQGSPIDVENLHPGDFRDIETIIRRFGKPDSAAQNADGADSS